MGSRLAVMALGAALVLSATAHDARAQNGGAESGAAKPGGTETGAAPSAPAVTSAPEAPPAAQAPPEEAAPKRECHLFGVTWDGGSKRSAVARAQSGLRDTIAEWRAKRGWRAGDVTIEPRRMRPNPYWRSKVRSELYYKPDVRTSTSYTVCWKGVISTAVCTAGAKICK